MEISALDRDLEKKNLSGFWRTRVPFHRPELPFLWKWREVQECLMKAKESESDPFDGHLICYINPANGEFTLPTMSCEVQSLPPGISTKAHRHTSTTLYHVFRGRGRTAVGEGHLEWEKGDSFVVPLWQWHRHENSTGEESILFSINDRPIMQALELYREESYE